MVGVFLVGVFLVGKVFFFFSLAFHYNQIKKNSVDFGTRVGLRAPWRLRAPWIPRVVVFGDYSSFRVRSTTGS